MISGKDYVPVKADLWSSGVILYAMLCGYLPFEDPNTTELYRKILTCEYELPIFLSIDAQDLIKRVLNTDPDKRYGVDQIREHAWCALNSEHIHNGLIVGYEDIPIDREIVKQVERYDLDKSKTQKCLEANNHDHYTTTYYLLLQKFIREGGVSPADFSRVDFVPYFQNFDKSSKKLLNQTLPGVKPPLPDFPGDDTYAIIPRRGRMAESREFNIGRAVSQRDNRVSKIKKKPMKNNSSLFPNLYQPSPRNFHFKSNSLAMPSPRNNSSAGPSGSISPRRRRKLVSPRTKPPTKLPIRPTPPTKVRVRRLNQTMVIRRKYKNNDVNLD